MNSGNGFKRVGWPDSRVASQSFTEIPKGVREPDAGKQRLGFLERVPSPLGSEFIPIPPLRQLPALLWRESRAALDITGLAPTIDVLFCTEEEHGASGEADIVPPVVCWNRKVNDSLTTL